MFPVAKFDERTMISNMKANRPINTSAFPSGADEKERNRNQKFQMKRIKV